MADVARARRYGVDWKLLVNDPRAGLIRGRLVNISASGVLFMVPVRYRLGSIAILEVEVGKASIIKCAVRVVREAPSATQGAFFFGGPFVMISDQHRRILSDALLELRRSEMLPMPLTARV